MTRSARRRIAVGAAAGALVLGGALGLSQGDGDGGVNVFIGNDTIPTPTATSTPTPTPTATPTATPTPEPGSANLWVDTNGGTCTRQGTAGAYSDGAACASFEAAYLAAQTGDAIRVKAGSYGSQVIDVNNTGLTAPVTIQGADGETVSLTRLEPSGSDWITFKDMTVSAPFGSGGQGVFPRTGTDHLTLDNVDVTGAEATIDTVDGTDFEYINSDFGTPGNTQRRLCDSGNSEPIQINGTDTVLIQNVKFHPFLPELNNPGDCGGDGNLHLETIRVNGDSDDVTIRHDWFLENDESGTARVFSSGEDIDRLHIIGNYFAEDAKAMLLCAGSPTNEVRDDYVIAYNTMKSSFETDTGCLAGELLYVGNIGTQPSNLACPGLQPDVKNLWVWSSSRSCGSDVWLIDATPNDYSAYNFAADGRHWSATSPAIDAGENTLCQLYTGGVDIDGDARDDGTCDAGADEYVP